MRPRAISRSLEAFSARTPTLLPATHTNSYALGARDVLLVEPATPYEDEQRAFLAWARGLPSSGRRPVAIVATHHHADHIGGLDVFARELGLGVWAHAEARQRLASEFQPLVTRTLHDGERLVLDGPVPETWEVLHTPGHATGHVCLYEPHTGALVAGDMVASVGTILIDPTDGHMRVYLEQLARLEALGARLALPAHGEPIENPSATFRRYIEHRLMREKKVLAAVASFGEAGVELHELVTRAYDDTPAHVWPIAVLSLRAHLEKLAAEGYVSTDGQTWRAALPAPRSSTT